MNLNQRQIYALITLSRETSFSENMLASVLHDEAAGKFYIRVKLKASLSPDTKQKIFVLFKQGPLLCLHESPGRNSIFTRPFCMKHKISEYYGVGYDGSITSSSKLCNAF